MRSTTDKILCAFIGGLLFFIISNPTTYQIVDSVLGGVVHIADSRGCPTTAGLLVHAVVFALVVYGLYMLK